MIIDLNDIHTHSHIEFDNNTIEPDCIDIALYSQNSIPSYITVQREELVRTLIALGEREVE